MRELRGTRLDERLVGRLRRTEMLDATAALAVVQRITALVAL
jgi:hypothetical protein